VADGGEERRPERANTRSDLLARTGLPSSPGRCQRPPKTGDPFSVAAWRTFVILVPFVVPFPGLVHTTK
jgi:hypothetical protein